MNTLDQPSASMPAHASRYAISLHSQLVRQKRPGDKSLLDFPTTVATANRHHRRQRMRRTLASAERACANNVSTDATSSSLERSYVELLKGACVPPGLFSLHISKVTHATFTHLCL
ncbi:putative replication protein [Zea mays]|uniref:Putative replication protein n=1 Tax=Zea mays TaxID=4577 RepID=A0A1D6EUR8_MAIZE|nr:putative replication protein [Zea mays]